MSEAAVRERVRDLLQEDSDRGRLRPVEFYERLFRGFESLVREQHAELVGRVGPDSVVPEDEIANSRVKETQGFVLDTPLGSEPPRDIDGYPIEGPVGRGGMSSILRVHDEALHRRLAMKVVRPDLRDLGIFSERLVEEAQVTAQLDHPGVVAVHAVGDGGASGPYFTMKLVRGRTLGDVFANIRDHVDGWSIARGLQVFLRICETLAYAHSKGVIHRDLKPANVMVGHFGEVYVMDWGLARVLGRPGPQSTGRATSGVFTDRRQRQPPGPTESESQGSVVGTPAYMSPEQARGQVAGLDERSDVYGIGALLYEMVAGSPPYADLGLETATRIVDAVVAGPPTPLAAVRPGLPPALYSIVDKAMARRPLDRYPGAQELREDLQNFVDGRVVAAHTAGPWAEVVSWVRRNRALAAWAGLAVLAVLVGLAVSTYLAFRMREESQRSRWGEYRAVMSAAATDFAADLQVAAARHLEAAPEDLRGWEWRLTSARIDSTIRRLTDARWAAWIDSRRLRIVASDGSVAVYDVIDESVTPEPVFGGGAFRVDPTGETAVRWDDTAQSLEFVRRDGAVRSFSVDMHSGETYDEIGVHGSRAIVQTETELVLLDGETGRRETIEFDTSWGRCAGFDAQGRRALLVKWESAESDYRQCNILDLDTMELRPAFRSGEPVSAAFLPDGRGVAIVRADGSLRLHSLDGEPIGFRVARGHRARTTAVAVTADGTRIATAAEDRTVRIWDTETGAPTAVLSGAASRLTALSFSPDGTLLVGSAKTGCMVWQVGDVGERPDRITLHDSFAYVATAHSERDLLVTGGWDAYNGGEGSLRLFDARTGVFVGPLDDRDACSFIVSHDGPDHILVSGGASDEGWISGPLRRYDLTTGELVRESDVSYVNHALDVDADVLVATLPTRIQFLDPETWEVRRSYAALAADRPVISPDGRLVAVPDDLQIQVIEVESGATLARLTGHENRVWAAAFSPDSRRLFSCSRDGTVREWSLDAREALQVVDRGEELYSLSFHPTEDRMLVGGASSVSVWDPTRFTEIVRFTPHQRYAYSLTWWSPGDAEPVLFTASGDRSVLAWRSTTRTRQFEERVARERLVAELTPHLASMLAAAGVPPLTRGAAVDEERVEVPSGARRAAVEAIRARWTGREQEVALQLALERFLRR